MNYTYDVCPFKRSFHRSRKSKFVEQIVKSNLIDEIDEHHLCRSWHNTELYRNIIYLLVYTSFLKSLWSTRKSVTSPLYHACVSSTATWIVSVITDGRFLSVNSVKQSGDQTLAGLQVQWHQLWQCLESLWLHALGCLRGRARRTIREEEMQGKKESYFQHGMNITICWRQVHVTEISGGLYCSTFNVV